MGLSGVLNRTIPTSYSEAVKIRGTNLDSQQPCCVFEPDVRKELFATFAYITVVQRVDYD